MQGQLQDDWHLSEAGHMSIFDRNTRWRLYYRTVAQTGQAIGLAESWGIAEWIQKLYHF